MAIPRTLSERVHRKLVESLEAQTQDRLVYLSVQNIEGELLSCSVTGGGTS